MEQAVLVYNALHEFFADMEVESNAPYLAGVYLAVLLKEHFDQAPIDADTLTPQIHQDILKLRVIPCPIVVREIECLFHFRMDITKAEGRSSPGQNSMPVYGFRSHSSFPLLLLYCLVRFGDCKDMNF